MRVIESILFDLDGVLIHSSSAHEAAFRSVLSRFNLREWRYGDLAGMRTREALLILLGRENIVLDELEIDALVTKKRELASQELSRSQPLDPDSAVTLQSLSKKYSLGLASSASQAAVDLFFELSQTRRFFKAVVCGDNVKEAKPSPEVFLQCARILCTAADRCLVVEDSASGILAAKNAGMEFVIRSGPFDLPPAITEGARGVINGLAELAALL